MLRRLWTPTLLAEGTRVRGDMHFTAQVQIYGTVEGSVLQESLESLLVGPSGWVHGSITAKGPVLIEGRVDGDIVSETRIRLLPSAKVFGSVLAPAVEVQPGARLEGSVAIRKVPESSTRSLRAVSS